jgi:endonuclease YncB( thermonuclease family)
MKAAGPSAWPACALGFVWRAIGIAAVLGSSAFAKPPEPFTGQVVAIADGDTLTVMVERQTHVVRLAEIDAPEKGQPWGHRAKQSLAELCFGRTAHVYPVQLDRYGRTVGRVRCMDGSLDAKDASREQVARGMAWFYTRYGKDAALLAGEQQARSARIGLWSDAEPIAPWDWRSASRKKASAPAPTD